jgi:hypothetical protein
MIVPFWSSRKATGYAYDIADPSNDPTRVDTELLAEPLDELRPEVAVPVRGDPIVG